MNANQRPAMTESKVDVTAQNKAMRAALQQFAECDLNENNCASLAVATLRIRTIARAALAACTPAKSEGR